MDKKSKQSEGSSFGQIVAREVLSQAQAMDARETMRYVVTVPSSSRTVSVFKMTQTGSGVTYVVERTRVPGLGPGLSVAFDDAKVAVRCFATTVLASVACSEKLRRPKLLGDLSTAMGGDPASSHTLGRAFPSHRVW